MKTLMYSLVAAAALTLGGVFTSTALADHGHGYNHNHGHNNNYAHNHYHGGYGYGGGYGNAGGAYYRPVYPYYPQPQPYYVQPYYPQNGLYFRGSNFGVRIGF